MVKAVKKTVVSPRIFGGMEAIFRGAVCFYFANEGKRSVEVGVPGYRPHGQQRKGANRRI